VSLGSLGVHFGQLLLNNFESGQHFLPVANAQRLHLLDPFLHELLCLPMLVLLLILGLSSVGLAALRFGQPLPNGRTQLVVALHQRLVVALLPEEQFTQLGEPFGHVGWLGVGGEGGRGEMGEALEAGGEAGEGCRGVDDELVEGDDALAHLVDVLSFFLAELHDLLAMRDYFFEKAFPHSQQSSLQGLPTLPLL
jgi:hypothetical protein